MINLEHLTEEERKIIMDVLQRDEQLRQAEQERVKKLKTELHELRRKSAVKVDGEGAGAGSGKKVCARCREPLGTIFNSGEVCPRCQHKVCTNCRVVLPSSKKWLCTICNKQLQIRLESGEAFGPQREGQADVYGSDLVKMSLAKSKAGLEPSIHVNGGLQSPSDSAYHGRGANVSSVGESTRTTYDEDYRSDISYEQSMVSGIESVGPSVSQRGSIAHHDGGGAGMNHAHDDGTIISNDVEGGRYGSVDITMERIPSRNGSPASSGRGRQGGDADPNMQDSKYNASESGIESIHSGYTNKNRAKGPLSLPVISSGSQIDNPTNAVQLSSNKRFKSELAFETESPKSKSFIHSGRDSGYDLSRQGICVDKIEHRQQFTTSDYSGREDTHVSFHSEEGQDIAPSFRAHPAPQYFNPSPLSNNNSPTSLTSPHTGSPRSSRHVTNKMYVSTGALSVFNKPTSNSDEYDTRGSERVYVGSGVYDSRYQSICDNVEEKFSDTPGDESSRQSDTDTQSITSSSTVAWDTVAEAREMEAKKNTLSPKADRQCITVESSDKQSAGSTMQNSRLTKAILQQHGGAVASSGYESASSMSVASESHPKRNGVASGGFICDFSSRKIVVDEQTLAILPEREYPGLNYLNSDSSPDDFVILESDEETLNVRLSEKIAPDQYPNKDNNNMTLLTMQDSSSHPKKCLAKEEMALSDILYLQEQGSLLQNFQSDSSSSIKGKTSAQHDSDNYKQDSECERKVTQTETCTEEQSQPGEPGSKVNDVQLTFHNMGSINSHYLTPQEKEDDSSDCSSVDLSKLDFSDSSDLDGFSDYDSENKGRKLLMLGNKLATFDNSRKEESNESVFTEWGLSDDTDGLVPLVLPGRRSRSGLSVKDKNAPSGEESDSLVSSFLKRFIRTPHIPQQPSPSAHCLSDEEDDSKNLSISVDISSDSDSVDGTCLEFDPALIADSSEEKEAVYKSKLEYNKALMRSLIKDLTSEEDTEQTSSEKEQTVRIKTGSQAVVNQSMLDGQSSSSQGVHSEQNVQKRSKRVSKNTATIDDSGESKPRRKKKGKSKSKLDDAEASVGYASKKGLMKLSKTQFGVLSSTPDGKTQLYTFGEDKDRPLSPVDLSRGRYSPLKDTGVHQDGAKPLDRPKTPFIRQSVPQPQIYRKQPSLTGGPRVPVSQKTCDEEDSSSSSSSPCDEEDCDEDATEQRGHDKIDNGSPHSFFRSRPSRQLSMPVDNSSDSELSVIMEEPEEDDANLEQSYDSKL